MMVVGNKDYSSDKITDTISNLGWIERLYELTGPVKRYTQNYMLENILRKYNKEWNYFSLPLSQENSWSSFLFNNEKNPHIVKDYSDAMIDFNTEKA